MDTEIRIQKTVENKRFYVTVSKLTHRFIIIDKYKKYTFKGFDNYHTANKFATILNGFQDKNNTLTIQNTNYHNVLDDFMNILNRLQANPTDEKLLNISRDMLLNMGVKLK